MEITFGQYVGKFIGPNEIKSIELTEERTPAGANVYMVEFGERKERITDKALRAMASDEAIDYTRLQKRKFTPLIQDMLGAVMEYDIMLYEIESLMRQFAGSMDDTYNRAQNYLWTKDDTKFIPGVGPLDMIPLSVAQGVVKSIPSNLASVIPNDTEGK